MTEVLLSELRPRSAAAVVARIPELRAARAWLTEDTRRREVRVVESGESVESARMKVDAEKDGDLASEVGGRGGGGKCASTLIFL